MTNDVMTTSPATSEAQSRRMLDAAALRYQSGFGNEFATEAFAGALPDGQNAPQLAPLIVFVPA